MEKWSCQLKKKKVGYFATVAGNGEKTIWQEKAIVGGTARQGSKKAS